jgi:uncharacterized protein
MAPSASPLRPLLVDGRHVADAEVAETWSARARGLLGRRRLPQALLLRPENSVHAIGMRVTLDIALLDADGHAVVVTVLRPWRATRPRRGVQAVLEAPHGAFARWGLVTGSVVTVTPAVDRPS